MLKFAKNTLLGVIGISLVSLATVPAQAHGWKKNHHRHGTKVVKVVKKVIYVAPRQTRRQARHHRRADRRWDRRQVRHQRWNRRHHQTRVVHHTRVIHHDRPVYRRGGNKVAGGVIGAAPAAML